MAGSLYAFGRNSEYSNFLFAALNMSSPVQTVAGGTNWQEVCASRLHTAAIKTDGTLWVWGDNRNGQLGDNTTTSCDSPIQTITGGTDWSSVSCGYYATAAIKKDGTLWLWGNNSYGELGDNTTIGKSSPIQTISGGTDWQNVVSGNRFIVATKKNGSLWMWGKNDYGQLGDNTRTNRSSPVQTIAGGIDWSSISCGNSHTAATKVDGTLWVWGYNQFGQLGNNTASNSRSSPVQTIAGGTDWIGISCGYYHTAAIKTDGTLWVWGYNSYGNLGDNTTIGKSSPVQTIVGGTDWSNVYCGYNITTAIKTDNSLWTWGNNTYGQLGDNSNVRKSSPVQTISGGTNWSSISCRFYASSAIKTDGTLWTWGSNIFGQIGGNTVFRFSPFIINNQNNWISIFGYSIFNRGGIKTDGTLWMWGYNTSGQLGDNTITDRSSPVQTIVGGMDWKQASSGYAHTAGIKNDGTLWLWGRNTVGQLGDNTVIHRSSPVQTISGGNNWLFVACGPINTAAIKTDGTLWIWGYNGSGQIGDNSITSKSSPVQTIAGGNDWSMVSFVFSGTQYAGNHVAAIKTDGTLWTWGNNGNGQLGDNTVINKSSPVQTAAGGNGWKQVSCGNSHTSAIKSDNTLWIWGRGTSGQLGNNTTAGKSSPIQTVTGGINWKQVSCGYNYTTATKMDNSLWTWGANSYGQLGDNSIIGKSSPIQTIAGGTTWYTPQSYNRSTFVLQENDPNQLSIDIQPQAGYNSNQLLVQPVINIDDSNGERVRIATNSVTVSVLSGNGSISGTTTVNAVDGIATFTDLILTGYGPVVLQFTSSGLTADNSTTFTINLPSAIIPKRSEVDGKIPLSSQLNIGELAINIDDKQGFIKKSDGTVLSIFNGEVADGGTF